ncbi:DUF6940 family protein [Roseibacillus persicicus]|uniref:DUF6940 family protein n=1 Tax=Roseibacillus persicicus TaxID=454148 RepID=UPI00398B63C2
MKYASRSAPVDNGVRLSRLFADGRCLTNEEVHRLWQEDAAFALFYSETILGAGYDGFCWETPPVTNDSLDIEHEFVVVDSVSHQNIRPNSAPFNEHFGCGDLTVAFPNLGRNGVMIAPAPGDDFDGGTIATFLRSASEERIADLWSVVGRETNLHLSDTPMWLSTAGLGVSWLHVRLDSRPKYYRYTPYKT